MRMAAIVILLAAHSLIAQQDPRGAIAGRVSDSSGAVVPDVGIRAVNTETNVAATNPARVTTMATRLRALRPNWPIDSDPNGPDPAEEE